MATQPDDDEPLELTDVVEPGDEPEERSEDDQQPDEVNDEDDKPVVAFEDEVPAEPEPENSTIRQMRQELRETKRKLAEAEKASAPKPIEVGEEPTLEGCDYDDVRFKAELRKYDQRVAQAAQQETQHAEQSRKANEEWQQDVTAFQQKRTALQFDDAEDTVEGAISSLDNVQQAVIVKAAADPALFLYALGKSDVKFAELSKIQDPIKLAAAVARMEGAVKVTTRKAPAPDRPLSGSAAMPVSGGEDKKLAQLEKEAERTGVRTAVIAYKRSLKEAAAAKGK